MNIFNRKTIILTLHKSKMKFYFLIALLFFFCQLPEEAVAQQTEAIVFMDYVKIKDDKKEEAMFFYENNWKRYRDIAVKRKLIQSYQLLEVLPDSINNFDLILVTVYKDSAQYLKSEKNFQPIIKETRPDGPALLNNLKPGEFRENVFFKVARSVFYSPQTKKK
jgi:hypothetical protein